MWPLPSPSSRQMSQHLALASSPHLSVAGFPTVTLFLNQNLGYDMWVMEQISDDAFLLSKQRFYGMAIFGKSMAILRPSDDWSLFGMAGWMIFEFNV
ncbi:unnamed protein product [Linum tenue]|uniref:Uncharacterized protein n=1 Tax=Linum tenue TaxID=586396 RepID=A0AAV0LGD7_9ROSI|nr:unnamed protein product [Linum tenue]